jgi:hypothetical protein
LANRLSGRFPSRTLIGTLIGVVCFFAVPLGIDHPSEINLIVRLMAYSGLGMAAGAVAEARKARGGRDAA